MTKRLAVLTAILGLAAATSSASAPPRGGTISVEPRTAGQDYDPSMPVFVSALADALAARGFTILDDIGHAASVAELTVRREEVGTARAKPPPESTAVLPGMSPGAGVGVAIPFSTGKSSIVPMRRTTLELRIRRRGEDAVAWRGSAVTVRSAGDRDGGDSRVAADLSEAVLRGYPAERAETIGVP